MIVTFLLFAEYNRTSRVHQQTQVNETEIDEAFLENVPLGQQVVE